LLDSLLQEINFILARKGKQVNNQLISFCCI